MKKFITHIILSTFLICGFFIAYSCSDNENEVSDEEIIDPILPHIDTLNITALNEVTIPAEGQVVVIDVEANIDYSIEMGEWIIEQSTRSTLNFSKTINSRVTLLIAKNTESVERHCQIIIKGEDGTKKIIDVTQEAAGEPQKYIEITLEEETDDIIVSAKGEMLVIRVLANIDYSVKMEAWVTEQLEGIKALSAVNSTITLLIAENTTYSVRKSQIVISGSDGTEKRINITQEAALEPNKIVEINLDNGENEFVELASTGGFIQIKVKSNTSYDYTLANWMKDEPVMNNVEMHESVIKIWVDANLTGYDRKNTLRFTWEGGKKEITIKQKAIQINVKCNNKFPYMGGTMQIETTIDDNAAKIVTYSLSSPELIIKESEVIGAKLPWGKLNLECNQPNYGISTKSFKIEMYLYYMNQEPVLRLFEVSQVGCPAISIAGEDMLNVNNKAGTNQFSVSVPFEGAKWSVDVYENIGGDREKKYIPCSWARITEITDDTFTVIWDKNEVSKERIAVIEVTLNKNTGNNTGITLIQEKALLTELTVNPIKLAYNLSDYDMIATYTPDTYWAKAILKDDGGFLSVREQKCKGGTLQVMLSAIANSNATENVAVITVQLYDNEDGELIMEKDVTVTQEAKPAIVKIQVELLNNYNQLCEEGTGRPVTLSVSGAEKYKLVMANGIMANWIIWNEIPDNYGRLTLWSRSGGTMGEQTIYVISADEDFNAERIEYYGKIVLVD